MAASNQSMTPAATEKTPIRRRFSVALNGDAAASHNTLVLGGLDLVIPLETDLDKDPLVPDELRLQSEGGGYESHVKSNDPGVKTDGDNPLLLYPFMDVPPGLYAISVKVGEAWRNVLTGFRVTRDGVFFGEESIEKAPSGSDLGTPHEEVEIEETDHDDTDEYDLHICEA